MPESYPEENPVRLYFKSYLKVIHNSVGSNLFRNFYVKTPEQGEFDAFGDGYNSCAFFVSSILVIFKKLSDFHGTVDNTIEDLKKTGWQEVNEPEPGDVLVWEPMKFPEGMVSHIGFYVGDGKAVSTSIKTKTPIEHDQNFGEQQRKITQIFRTTWDDQP
jgi:hypothetical protein